MKIKYGVIGSGAIGGFYGSKLAHAGKEVHFLFHSDYHFVCENGLQVDSCDGSFHLDGVNAYQRTIDMPKCDVILVGLKSVNNGLLLEMLPPLLHPKSLVILIQNGIGLEADLQQVFPQLQIAAGLAFICSSKTAPGRVSHQCYGSINVGNFSVADDNLLNAVIEDFRSSGITANLVEYHEARWKKAVWNMPFNGMTVALNTQTDLLLGNPSTRQLIFDQMMEVVNAATRLGVAHVDRAFAEKMMETTDAMVPYSPSMKLAFDFHRPMEVYYLYTRPIQEAAKIGCAMPKLSMLEAMLRFLNTPPLPTD